MPSIRSVASWLLPLAVLAGSARADDSPPPGEAGARTWHGPAEWAEDAAKPKPEARKKPSPARAVAPPAPKPAERPASATPAAASTPAPADPAPVKAAEPAPKDAKAKPAEAEPKKDATKKDEPKQDAAKQDAAKKDDAKKEDAKTKEAANDKKKDKKPAPSAKQLFGTVKSGAPLEARAVGWYAKGCLAGGKALTIDGPGWQVMRLSRNRNWGHPKLVSLLERLARESTDAKEWPGLLVGDMSQPRGGPMTSGHASHQVGLDADIWLTPMPNRKLTPREREDMSAVSMLANAGEVNPKVWGDGQFKLIKRAASYTSVERILVHPAIKKALCEKAGDNRGWLSKVRPYFGHFYHFHIRIGCPSGSTNCQAQPAVPGGDGCDTELKDWLKRVAPKPKKPPVIAQPKPTQPVKPKSPRPEITLADLPPDCKTVLMAGGNKPPTERADVFDTSKDAGPVNDTTESTAAPAPPPAAKKADGDKKAADGKSTPAKPAAAKPGADKPAAEKRDAEKPPVQQTKSN
jgi:penicillin-insensitive murein DD-endopeptidase